MISSRQRWMLLAAGLAAAPAPAGAQLLDRYFPTNIPRYALGVMPRFVPPEDNTVAARRRPEYDYNGVRLGAFTLQPRVAQGIGYDSNIFAERNGRDAPVEQTEALLDITSNWSRNSVFGRLGIDDRRYITQPSNTPDQGRTNWNAALGGSYQIGRDLLSASYSHLVLHQERTDIEGGFFDSPLRFSIDDARASYRTTFGRFSVAPDVVFQSIRYDSNSSGRGVLGPLLDQIGSDRNVVDAGLTGRYSFAPERDAVLVVRGAHTDFTDVQPGFVSRDSDTLSVLAGFDDSSGGVFGYRFLAGYQVRNFRDDRLSTRSKPIVEAGVNYSPSRLTTFTGLLSRRLEDAAAEALVGYTYTQARLAVDHELLRNVVLNGYVQYLRADFLENGGSNKIIGGGGKATWLLNRNMRLALTYDYIDRSANRGANYDRSVALLRLEFGL